MTGAPGTGKTLFALHFLIEGVKNKEPCLYITSEETADSLRNTAKAIGVDLSKYKNFIIYEQDVSSKILSLEKPLAIMKNKKVKRVVLDSLTLFEYVYHESDMDFRKGILNFIKRVKESGVTMLATSERLTTDIDKMRYLPQDFIFEGLVTVTRVRKSASFERVVTIEKMRGKDHTLNIMPFTISKTGITVLNSEIPFSLLEFDEHRGK